MRDYGKVHTTFWSSETTGALSDDGRLLAMYLMTSPHTTIAGVFRLPDGYVAEDMRWTTERVAQGFAELLSKGFANRCETTKWVWIVKHLAWNPPENPNQRKAAAKCAVSIPDECGWKRQFYLAWAEFLGLEIPAARAKGSRTVAKQLPNQEQEQEQEKRDTSAEPTSVPCPYESIIALYHQALPELPAVRLMTKLRQAAMRKLWGFVLSSRKPDGSRRAETAAEALEWLGGYFARAAENDFLMGRTQRTGEHAGWRCDLDFLLTEKGMKHVIEKTQVAA